MRCRSGRSSLRFYDIGLLLSMFLACHCGADVTADIYGTTWKVKNLPKQNILTVLENGKRVVEKNRRNEPGAGAGE